MKTLKNILVMKHISSTSVIILLLNISILSISPKSYAQPEPQHKNFASPTASSLGVYGDIGVNYFTGSPDITIDLFKVEEDNITIPINISYSTSLVKPNEHSGFTGLGWSMGCLGQITRIQKDIMDEKINTENTAQVQGFYKSYNKVNPLLWTNRTYMRDLYDHKNSVSTKYEIEADEFVFNIPGGYSGKFQMGYDGKWQVICDADIKVIFDETKDFISIDSIREDIYNPMSAKVKKYTDRYFNKFTLVTPDGTRYTFGGKNATEYSTTYFEEDEMVVPTTWFLTKVTPVNGRSVNLYYSKGPLICNIYYSSLYTSNSRGPIEYRWKKKLTCTDETSQQAVKQGFLMFPVYLDSIKTSSETIVFDHSNSKELRYPIDDLRLPMFRYFGEDGATLEMPNKLQWHKLDNIKIKNHNQFLVKRYDFQYTDAENTRLKLLSIQERDKNGIAKPAYRFTYKPSTFSPLGSDAYDHWGYNKPWNIANKYLTLEELIKVYYNLREPDTTRKYCQSELLDTLYYPTSGFTIYEFEPHQYSKVVNKDRSTLTVLTKPKYAGGVRIKKIKSYKDKYALPLTKEYLYVNNYEGQLDYAGLASSGVLCGLPEYLWLNYKARDINDKEYDYSLFSTGSVLPPAVNAQGSHIGYTQVIELVPNNGYIKYTFTNFDTQEKGIYIHKDEPARSYFTYNISVYSPYTSRAMERGKIQKTEIFNKLNQKVKEKTFTYIASSDTSYCIKVLELKKINMCHERELDDAFFGTAYKKYQYSYLLASETEKIYPTNDPGNEGKALINYKSYDYDMKTKLVKATIQLQSDSSKIITYNNYPSEYSSKEDTANVHLESMNSDNVHFVNAIVAQQILRQEKDGSSKLIGGTFNRYDKRYLPISTFQLDLKEPVTRQYTSTINHTSTGYPLLLNEGLPFSKNSEFKYDQYGNVSEVRMTGQPVVSILYSYNHLLPVAKIINATNQEIATALNYTDYNKLSLAIGYGYTNEAKTKVNSLRSLLPKARVTSATYDPIVGITSITDENSKSSYFLYDPFSRLQIIKDNDLNIIKAYRYNYKQ